MIISNNLRAAFVVMFAMTMITTNDAIVKHLTQVFTVGQIMFLRGLLVCFVYGMLIAWRQQPLFALGIWHRWYLLRALFELLATLFFLTGLSMLPIAIATTLGFTAPIFLAILAAVVLKEQVGLLRWAAVLAGFSGVLLISQPASGDFHWPIILPVICAIFVALRDLSVRFVPKELPASQIAFTNAWVVTIGGGLYAMFQGWGSAEWHWYFWFIAIGFAIFCGYLGMIVGSRMGDLSFIAPFKYISILVALAYGYLVWGEVPDRHMLLGASIIVASGVVLVLEERRASRPKR